MDKNSNKLVLTSGCLIALVAIIGIVFSQYSNFSGLIFGNNNTVNQNNSAEERRREIEQAKSVLVSQILRNVGYIDNRLDFVAASLLDGNIKGDLKEIQKKLAGLLKDSSSTSHRQLIAQNQIASLRQAFNGRPLRIAADEPSIQILIDGNVNADQITAFYSGLAELEDASESLMTNLLEVAASTNTSFQPAKFDQQKIALAIATLRNRSMIAYLKGIIALESLGTSNSKIQNKLTTLKHLEPKDLISQSEIYALLQENLKEAETIVAERKTLLKETQTALKDSLKIQNSDSWDVVVGKAIALRKRGQIAEAVAAFALYGEMFSKNDPTAEQYSRTARQFTLQTQELNLESGVYIYKILPGDNAQKVGLMEGDIIVGYDGKTVATVDAFKSALESSSGRKSTQITYLRLQNDGKLLKKSVSISRGAIGAGLMPI